MPPAARNPFEKGFLDFPKLFIIKSFWGSRDLFSKRSLDAGGKKRKSGTYLMMNDLEILSQLEKESGMSLTKRLLKEIMYYYSGAGYTLDENEHIIGLI